MKRAWRRLLGGLLPIGALLGSGLLLVAPPAGAQGGWVEAQEKIADDRAGFTGGLANSDLFGSAVARIPDLDGDGVDELAVGAPGDDDGGSGSGAIWVLFLRDDGSVRLFWKISATHGGFAGVLKAGDAFGSSIAAIGDLDGNGVCDLAVGAPGDDDVGSNRGAVWVLLMRYDGTVRWHLKFSAAYNLPAGTLQDGDAFGSSLAYLGDHDQNGRGDLAIGATGDDDGGINRGAVWILLIGSNGTLDSFRKISSLHGGFSGALDDGDLFGAALAVVGDVNQDGVGDLVVGAPADDDGGINTGAAWVLFLDGNGAVIGHSKVSAAEGGFGGLLEDADRFGAALAPIGDISGGPSPEFLVGVPGADGLGMDRGAVWILSVDTAGEVASELEVGDGAGGFSGVLHDEDGFGSSIASLGDLDGNGSCELAVGAVGDDTGGFRRGAAWIPFTSVAAQVHNPGTGVNPPALKPGTEPPRLGRAWDPMIELIPFTDEPTIHFLAISDRRFQLAGGDLAQGELLISLDPADLVGVYLSVPGRRFRVPIPADPQLVGRELFAQGAQLHGVDNLLLTNGLDLVVGF